MERIFRIEEPRTSQCAALALTGTWHSSAECPSCERVQSSREPPFRAEWCYAGKRACGYFVWSHRSMFIRRASVARVSEVLPGLRADPVRISNPRQLRSIAPERQDFVFLRATQLGLLDRQRTATPPLEDCPACGLRFWAQALTGLVVRADSVEPTHVFGIDGIDDELFLADRLVAGFKAQHWTNAQLVEVGALEP
jgi:hypothetical protein